MMETAIHRPTMSRSEAEGQIRDLAERFRVTAGKVTFDYVADTFARLSDAETSVDEVEVLLIHLIRKHAVDWQTALDLHASYLSDT